MTGKVFTAVSRSSPSPIDNGKTPDFVPMVPLSKISVMSVYG
ncbi:hypothetical protein [Thalassospira sp. NFXS8]